jgi:hypothetical protein
LCNLLKQRLLPLRHYLLQLASFLIFSIKEGFAVLTIIFLILCSLQGMGWQFAVVVAVNIGFLRLQNILGKPVFDDGFSTVKAAHGVFAALVVVAVFIILMVPHLVEGRCPAADVADAPDLGYGPWMDDIGDAIFEIALAAIGPVNGVHPPSTEHAPVIGEHV